MTMPVNDERMRIAEGLRGLPVGDLDDGEFYDLSLIHI